MSSNKKTFLNGNTTIIQSIDMNTNEVIAEDTLNSFVDNNSEPHDEEILLALYELKTCRQSEITVPTWQGYCLLKVKRDVL
jgi:hypothetical protein